MPCASNVETVSSSRATHSGSSRPGLGIAPDQRQPSRQHGTTRFPGTRQLPRARLATTARQSLATSSGGGNHGAALST